MARDRVSSGERGAILEVLVIGIVLVGVVAFGAWRFIEADKAQNEADRAVNGLSQAVISEQLASLDIKEFGLTVRYDSTHGPLEYRTDSQVVTLTNKKFTLSDEACAVKYDTEDIGTISVFDSEQAGPGAAQSHLKKEGKYYYLSPVKVSDASKDTCLDPAFLKRRSTIFPSIFLD